MRILIVEDDPDIAANIGDYLMLLGNSVDFAGDGVLGLKLASQESFDVIVLDINLPKLDGFNMCQQLRDKYLIDTPVLMLTARDALGDKIRGFEAGAWDYLVKPFALEELNIRLLTLAQRAQPNKTKIISVGDLELDTINLTVSRSGKPLTLHKTCVKILELLMQNSPNIVKRQDIEYLIWGKDAPDSNPLRSHMHELRSAVDKPYGFAMLKTIRGVGFQLVSPEDNNGN